MQVQATTKVADWICWNNNVDGIVRTSLHGLYHVTAVVNYKSKSTNAAIQFMKGADPDGVLRLHGRLLQLDDVGVHHSRREEPTVRCQVPRQSHGYELPDDRSARKVVARSNFMHVVFTQCTSVMLVLLDGTVPTTLYKIIS
ncbi:hypothetical protein PR002_g5322 [Phytophthora rubi]|uniref:Uncharacterized protein n=1 Tax=Phytophthora rubi TaxID=129364 RepID=A0A6A3N2T4_9STRA|nr:hypothetical protein PR002_g5322 [Phytophthora rubi]